MNVPASNTSTSATAKLLCQPRRRSINRPELANLSIGRRPGLSNSSVAKPMVRAGNPNRVRIYPVLGSCVQARQSWARVYIGDRELGTANDTYRDYGSYDEAADHFSLRRLARKS
jgi:hypothetical protein